MRTPLVPLLAVAIALALVPPAFAQDDDDDDDDDEAQDSQGVGIYVSNIAGSGLAYHRTYADGWGWRVAGLGRGEGAATFFNVGGALTRELDRRPWGTLYGLLGAGAGLDSFYGAYGMPPANNVQFNLSPGIGFAWGPLVAEIGYSVYYNGVTPGFGPGGGLGLVWWF